MAAGWINILVMVKTTAVPGFLVRLAVKRVVWDSTPRHHKYAVRRPLLYKNTTKYAVLVNAINLGIRVWLRIGLGFMVSASGFSTGLFQKSKVSRLRCIKSKSDFERQQSWASGKRRGFVRSK